MNVNEMGSRILQTYKDLEEWPKRTMPERLLDLVSWIDYAYESYQSMREFGFGLIHSTCCISAADCGHSDVCDVPEEERATA